MLQKNVAHGLYYPSSLSRPFCGGYPPRNGGRSRSRRSCDQVLTACETGDVAIPREARRVYTLRAGTHPRRGVVTTLLAAGGGEGPQNSGNGTEARHTGHLQAPTARTARSGRSPEHWNAVCALSSPLLQWRESFLLLCRIEGPGAEVVSRYGSPIVRRSAAHCIKSHHEPSTPNRHLANSRQVQRQNVGAECGCRLSVRISGSTRSCPRESA